MRTIRRSINVENILTQQPFITLGYNAFAYNIKRYTISVYQIEKTIYN